MNRKQNKQRGGQQPKKTVKDNKNKNNRSYFTKKYVEKLKKQSRDKGVELHITNVPATKGVQIRKYAPKINDKGNCFIRNTEIVTTIVGNGGAQYVKQILVNPSSGQCFKWLAIAGQAFEKFKIRYMKFIYCPIIGTSSSGELVMYLDYDPTDPIVGSNEDGLTEFEAISTPTYASSSLSYVPQEESLKNYFIYDEQTPQSPSNMKSFFPCTLNICVNGVTNAGVGVVGAVGRIMVEYGIELKIPTIDNAVRLYNSRDEVDRQQVNQNGETSFYQPQLQGMSIKDGVRTVATIVQQDGANFLKVVEPFCGELSIVNNAFNTAGNPFEPFTGAGFNSNQKTQGYETLGQVTTVGDIESSANGYASNTRIKIWGKIAGTLIPMLYPYTTSASFTGITSLMDFVSSSPLALGFNPYSPVIG